MLFDSVPMVTVLIRHEAAKVIRKKMIFIKIIIIGIYFEYTINVSQHAVIL